MSVAVVVGAGTMGAGIAAVLLAAGDDVTIVEASAELGSSAMRRVEATIEHMAHRAGDVDVREPIRRLAVVEKVEAAPRRPSVAIEAVPEQNDLKRRVLVALEGLGPELLGSNTSSLSITELAADLRRPDRFLGLHFFNPVPVMGLIEIVIGQATSVAAQDAAVALAERLGKAPVLVRDAPGFASSRLGVVLGLEAIRMVEQGVAEPADIDLAMQLGYRHPMGPLRLTDLVGLDVRLDIARNLQQAYGDRFAPPALLVEMVEQGKLGKKTGIGFYDWESR